MIVYVLSWFERHEGCSTDGFDVYATKEAAVRAIESYNATANKADHLQEWKSTHHEPPIVAAWANGNWYVYLTEHGVQE